MSDIERLSDRATQFPGVLAVHESESSNMLGAARSYAANMLGAARSYAAERGGPFRAPHFTAGIAGIGGRTRLLHTGELRSYPGEVELAQGGVLYLGEVAEFSRRALDRVYQGVMESDDPPFVVAVVSYGSWHEPFLELSMRRLGRVAPWLLRLPRIKRAEQLADLGRGTE